MVFPTFSHHFPIIFPPLTYELNFPGARFSHDDYTAPRSAEVQAVQRSVAAIGGGSRLDWDGGARRFFG